MDQESLQALADRSAEYVAVCGPGASIFRVFKQLGLSSAEGRALVQFMEAQPQYMLAAFGPVTESNLHVLLRGMFHAGMNFGMQLVREDVVK